MQVVGLLEHRAGHALLRRRRLRRYRVECHGRAAECYEKVRTPDVYRAVDRAVLVRPGYREVVQTPAVYGTRNERVLIAPAQSYTVR